jgi:gamma-glutamyl:cysteine ligase YbdK (ATP-grasp superfamily)
MAIAITRDTFTDDDFARFSARLETQLTTLSQLCAEPRFSDRAPQIGAELELPIVGGDWRPSLCNEAILADLADPRATVEIARFNLELNLTPVATAGAPFSVIGAEIGAMTDTLRQVAALHGARVVPVGILPSIMPSDLTRSAMTDQPRYRGLENSVRRLRGGPARVRIQGEDPLSVDDDGVMLEAATTSLQMHLCASAERFADTYNAAQLATVAAIAVAGNSPIFLDHLLWEETRIAVFKHSMDARTTDDLAWHRPPRVSFGSGWVRRGAPELFAEAVRLHPPLLPVCGDAESELDVGAPPLHELRLHQGTVWRWNRAIYDPRDGGGLRVEFRALPSGPSTVDMMANAAYLIGLTVGLRDDVNALIEGFPFVLAETGFYRAARDGLKASIRWPGSAGAAMNEVTIPALTARLLPVAERGLASLGVDAAERTTLLGVIADRVAMEQTGARWLRAGLHQLRGTMRRRAALDRLVSEYAARVDSAEPVHRWTMI